jgi:hypothetical protein
MADVANALDGVPNADETRQKIAARFNEWVSSAPADRPATE